MTVSISSAWTVIADPHGRLLRVAAAGVYQDFPALPLQQKNQHRKLFPLLILLLVGVERPPVVGDTAHLDGTDGVMRNNHFAPLLQKHG